MPTAGAGVGVVTGWRVKVTESMANRAAPAVGTSALFALVWPVDCCVVVMGASEDR